jgi:surfeit locus 1 family protein
MREYSPVLNTRRNRSFAPRLVPTLLAACAVVLFAALGNWQLGRAQEKRVMARNFSAGGPALDWAQLPADPPRFQRVSLRGHYDGEHQFLLDNMSHESVAGVQVLTPLVLDNGDAVLVNRGWLPFGATRQDLPSVVQYPSMPDLAAALGRELAPRQVLLDPGVPDGYVREWNLPGTTPDRHLGYAVQWYAFAALAAAIWFVLSVRKTGEPA